MPLLLEAAGEQEPVHPVVVGDEDRAGGRERCALTHATPTEGRRGPPRAAGTPARSDRRAREAPSSSSVLACCSSVRQSSANSPAPERRTVRLQRVRRPAQLLGMSARRASCGGSRPEPAHRARNVSITSRRNSSPPRSRRLSSALASRLTQPPAEPASPFREWARALQRLRELLRTDRLRDVVVHPGREAGLAVLGHRVRRHRDDARAGLRPASARRSAARRRDRRAPASARPSARRRRAAARAPRAPRGRSTRRRRGSRACSSMRSATFWFTALSSASRIRRRRRLGRSPSPARPPPSPAPAGAASSCRSAL